MNKGLVSIIVPCYNVERVIDKCIKSILNQTYKKLEVIFVNDGSTDNTEKIILSYKREFEKKNMIFKYIYQENKGLGGAINTGLKHFTGEYLVWPDADDTLASTSIEKKVVFLENKPEYGSVTSDANIYKEDDLLNPIRKITDIFKYNNEEEQFEYMLLGKSIFCSGCHMVKTKAFLDVNPNREIFEARRGQNWQMLLPVYYKYKRGFINEPLYNYIIYKDSMSSGDDTKEKKIQRENEHLDIISNTLKNMLINDSEKERYYKMFYEGYIRRIFYIGIDYKDINLSWKYYRLAQKNRVYIKSKTSLLVKVFIRKFLNNIHLG